MQFSSIDIGLEVKAFLQNLWRECKDHIAVNERLRSVCGILNFFENHREYEELGEFLTEEPTFVREADRAEYGDFQTNINLANRIASYLSEDGCSPEVMIEPTFGKGHFILAALRNFPRIKQIRGIEIYKPYVWEAKFAILKFFLETPSHSKPDIILFHQDVFDCDFQKLSREFANKQVLILGNPPWVTNAKLGALNSLNLPVKSNFKSLNGFDAMTGKGNFDIGEYITLAVLRAFQNHSGHMAFLVKNSVVKNIVFDQKNTPLRIGKIKQYPIDAKKEFGAAVEASLFSCELSQGPDYQCMQSAMFVDAIPEFYFGWVENKFVSNTEKYESVRLVDGICPFEWRQGLKHDCSAIMELERINGHFCNNKRQTIQLEHDLIYGILKSSDLKGGVTTDVRKFTIVTQNKIGQDTAYIQKLFPQTYAYLHSNWEYFVNRKSSIYRGKPPFSIFGIGDYSFLPYKVAISGLYKSPTFTLVLPLDEKPLMLDDTCYFIGFEELRDALIIFFILNHQLVTSLLDAITFPDAKRTFTKDILMRINIEYVAAVVDFEELNSFFADTDFADTLTQADYDNFRQRLGYIRSAQMQLELA